MLKWVVFLLVVLNAVALAWQWDALAPWGWGPEQHREPERLKQQLRPEAIQQVPLHSKEPAATQETPSPNGPEAHKPAPVTHTPPALPTVPPSTPPRDPAS